MILDKIVKQKKIDLEEFKKVYTVGELKVEAEKAPARPSFKDALQKEGLSIIGELKKASPSKGVIREVFEPQTLIKYYENSVDAVSILTEEKFFLGKPEYLKEASKTSPLPLLRKDFIIDEIQVYEAKVLGASAILLICAILSLEELRKFMALAKSLGLDVLVETHNQEELDMALAADADIIGINNRNLNTFDVSLDTTLELLKGIPQGKVIVSESGFHTIEDIKKISGSRVDAVLVGESFMRADDIEEHARRFKASFK